MSSRPPIDLARFCASQSDGRSYLRQPFHRGGFMYGCNGQIAVRVVASPEAVKDVPELEAQHIPKLESLFTGMSERTDWRTLPPMQMPEECHRCKGTGVLVGEICMSCDGDGEFEHYDYTYECKSCDGDGIHEAEGGTGRLRCNVRGCFRGLLSKGEAIGANRADAVYLYWLSELPDVSISPGKTGEHIFFKFTGGDGVLMPRLS